MLTESNNNDERFATPQEPEIAARKPNLNTKFENPLELAKKNLYSVVLNANSLFRLGLMGSILNNKLNEEFSTTDVSQVINFDLNSYAEPVTADRLRETASVLPGNGKSPISIQFTEQLFNIGDEIVERIFKHLPEDVAKGITLSKFMEAIYEMDIDAKVLNPLTEALDGFKEKFLEPLTDIIEFKIKIEESVFNEDYHTSNLDYTLSINIDSDIYKEVIDSEEFSPYLVYLWVYNSLRLTQNRTNVITDPRKVSKHKDKMLKLNSIRPKVNKLGFAINGNGLPIYIPASVDTIDQFIKVANSCVDEDGVFRRDFLVDEHQLGDKILYVDWVNDVLAYTTSTGILSVFDLGNVVPFDTVTEYNFLSTPIKASSLQSVMQVITESFKNITDTTPATKYTTDPEVKNILTNMSPVVIYTKMVNATNATDQSDVTLYHVCGGQLNELEEVTGLVPLVKAFKCLIKYLNELRKSNQDTLKIPARMKSQGIIYRLIGVEYILQALDKYDDNNIETFRKDWAEEQKKLRVDPTIKEFDIPNVKIGRGGLMGLLPHQGTILSSMIKSPIQSILSISTGGGKTITGTVTAIFGILNTGNIPMILTKSNLIRGTVAEINQICKGEINAIPFTPVILRRMSRLSGINTFEKLLKWFRSLPKNTILISSYSSLASRRTFYEDLELVRGFCEFPVPTNQFMLIIKLLGIRFVIGDESHMIKNPLSARSRNSYAIFSHADNRVIESGTIVSNTVPDLVGQSRAISPYIFGDDPVEFSDRYGIRQGLIKTDEDAKKIKDRLRGTTAYHEADEEDWSYMLPLKSDDIVFANLTPLQQEFYTLLMREAELIMLEALKSKKKIKAVSEDGEDDEDEEEDEDEDDDNEDGDDEEEARIVAAAKVYLQNVEMFLASPDTNEQYLKWEKKPQGDDLISPKVRVTDKIIEEHVIKFKDQLSTNKIMVFGWNVDASAHFMRHSKFASKALHYTAGNTDVIHQFENNPNAIILVGNEGGIREGNNWQFASLICRLQSVWAPGDHKQTLARMFRPDPRGKYNRERIRHVWVMSRLPNNEPTLDGVKIARLASKYISNARLQYEGRMEWRRVSGEFDELKMLKMKLSTIFETRASDLEPYFDSWKTFVNWQNDLNFTAKRRLAEKLESENNVDLIDKSGNIIDINKFIQLAMFDVKSTFKIPGSKRVYVPYIANSLPPDPDNYEFSVIGKKAIPVGTVVHTEFGPGIVKTDLKKALKVTLYNGAVIGLKKSVVFLPAKSRYKDFSSIVKNPTKWRNESYSPHGTVGTAKILKEAKVKADEEEEIIDDMTPMVEEEKEELIVYAAILNSWPALIIDEDLPELRNLKGWNRIDPFVSLEFRNWPAAENFLEIIDQKTYVSDKDHEKLMAEIEKVRDGKAMLLTKRIDRKDFRNFFIDQRRKLGKTKSGKVITRPYLITTEDKVKIAFDISSHEPAFISWLNRNRSKFKGLMKLTRNDAMWINTFESVREAMEDLQNLSKLGNIDLAQIKQDLVDVKNQIAKLRKPRTRPQL